MDDIQSWPLVALAAALARSAGALSIIYTVLGLVAALVIIRYPVRALFAAIVKRADLKMALPHWLLFVVFAILFIVAWFADMVGITSVLGAFLTGLALPRNPMLLSALLAASEDFTTVILLPLFFALSGLRTEFGLLDEWQDWGLVMLTVVMAFATKLVGVGLTARYLGYGRWESVAFGVLMTTKGLVALVAANIGLEEGVITPVFFSMAVAMVLIATFLVVPLSDLIPFGARDVRSQLPPEEDPSPHRLVLVIMHGRDKLLLSVASLMQRSGTVFGMRIMPITERASDVMGTVFHLPVDTVVTNWRAHSQLLGLNLTALPIMSRQPADELVAMCGEATLLLAWDEAHTATSKFPSLLSDLLRKESTILALVPRNLPIAPMHVVIAYTHADHHLRAYVQQMARRNLVLSFLPLDDVAEEDNEWRSTMQIVHDKDILTKPMQLAGTPLERLDALCCTLEDEYDIVLVQTIVRNVDHGAMAPEVALLHAKCPKSFLVLFTPGHEPGFRSPTQSTALSPDMRLLINEDEAETCGRFAADVPVSVSRTDEV